MARLAGFVLRFVPSSEVRVGWVSFFFWLFAYVRERRLLTARRFATLSYSGLSPALRVHFCFGAARNALLRCARVFMHVVCVYMYIYMYAHMQYAAICLYIHNSMHARMCARMHVWMYVCMHVCMYVIIRCIMYVCMCVGTSVGRYVGMYVMYECVYVCMYCIHCMSCMV